MTLERRGRGMIKYYVPPIQTLHDIKVTEIEIISDESERMWRAEFVETGADFFICKEFVHDTSEQAVIALNAGVSEFLDRVKQQLNEANNG